MNKRPTTNTQVPVSEIGMLPPQAIELEEAVLGATLLEQEAMEIIISILKPKSFYKEQNGKVFKAMLDLHAKHDSIDILTTTEQLKINGDLEFVGGSYYVCYLTNRIASSANIEFHARIVEQKFMQREMIRILTNGIKEAYADDCDIFELINETDKDIFSIVNEISGNQVEVIGPIKDKVIDECEAVLKTGHRSGIACSIEWLNNQTNGWQKGDLIVLAARPGMGKTSAAIDFGLHPALNGKKTLFFSLEMSKTQIASRVMSMVSEMKLQQIVNKKVDGGDIDYLRKNTTVLDKIGLFVDDTAGITLNNIRNKSRKLKKKENIELIIIDYLQLMDGDAQAKGNREQEISMISRGLKKLAKELEIPIIALSQLSREVEKRPNRKPMLADLRESGAIEQDADIVIFMLRPEYYGFKTYDMIHYEEDAKNLLIFIIAKFRNGSPGEVKAKWRKELAMIKNFEDTAESITQII